MRAWGGRCLEVPKESINRHVGSARLARKLSSFRIRLRHPSRPRPTRFSGCLILLPPCRTRLRSILALESLLLHTIGPLDNSRNGRSVGANNTSFSSSVLFSSRDPSKTINRITSNSALIVASLAITLGDVGLPGIFNSSDSRWNRSTMASTIRKAACEL